MFPDLWFPDLFFFLVLEFSLEILLKFYSLQSISDDALQFYECYVRNQAVVNKQSQKLF